jgi:transmembrane sensor
MKTPTDIRSLISKYQAGTATPEEMHRLNDWYHSFDDSEVEILTEDDDPDQMAERIKSRLIETIQDKSEVSNQKRWQLLATASMILILLAGGFYYFLQAPKVKPEVVKTPAVVAPVSNDLAPGGNRAILTLANGSTIILDHATKGIISTQGNMKVEKLDSGLLAYNINENIIGKNEELFFNMISTPRGGQYQVTLSDGTNVWLNAASSIRFPVKFIGTERKVTVTGETYFEVAPDPTKPFKVKVATTEVEVMGTHFNINAYDDEAAIKTTLLEGKVKVSVARENAPPSAKYLLPGQQSGISNRGEIRIVKNADTEEAVAWKNGRFQFKSADLKSILRQLARWYDVDIEHRGNVDLHFTGQITRNDSVSKVFEKLKLTGEVNFNIEGKKIIVSP